MHISDILGLKVSEVMYSAYSPPICQYKNEEKQRGQENTWKYAFSSLLLYHVCEKFTPICRSQVCVLIISYSPINIAAYSILYIFIEINYFKYTYSFKSFQF